MLTNNDLETINNVIDYLFKLATNYKDGEMANNAIALRKISDKIYRNKKIQNVKSNEYNKNNKKYHCLINQKSYYKKRNNQAKVKELEEKINEHKNRTI